MAEISMETLALELENLRMRVTSLVAALENAGIAIPPTPLERLQETKQLEREWAAAAARGE